MTETPKEPVPKDKIRIYVNDRENAPITGAKIEYFLGEKFAGAVPNSRGYGDITRPPKGTLIRVTVSFGVHVDSVRLDSAAETYIFTLPVSIGRPVNTPAVAIGVVLIFVAFLAGYLSKCPNSLQTWLVIVFVVLGTGLLLYGFLLRLSMSLRLGWVSAGGAAAFAVMFFLVKPAVLEKVSCDVITLRVRVVDSADKSPIKAKVDVDRKGDGTSLETDDEGRCKTTFNSKHLGDPVEISVRAEGFLPKEVQYTLDGESNAKVELDRVPPLAP